MAVKVFPALAQKIAPIFIVLTAIAWFLIVIGFGIGSREVQRVKDGEESLSLFNTPKGTNDREAPPSYMFWMTIFAGLAAVVVGILHAAFWKPYSMFFGAITAFLSVLFLSALGMILYHNGHVIRLINDNEALGDVDIPAWFALEFAGAFLAILFWTPVMMLWFFYDVDVTFRKA